MGLYIAYCRKLYFHSGIPTISIQLMKKKYFILFLLHHSSASFFKFSFFAYTKNRKISISKESRCLIPYNTIFPSIIYKIALLLGSCRGRYEPVEFKAAMIRSFACSFSGPMAICAKLPVANIVYGNYNGQAADHVPTVPSGLLSSSSSSSFSRVWNVYICIVIVYFSGRLFSPWLRRACAFWFPTPKSKVLVSVIAIYYKSRCVFTSFCWIYFEQKKYIYVYNKVIKLRQTIAYRFIILRVRKEYYYY